MNNIYRIIEKEHGKRKNELLRKDSNVEKHFAKLLNEASIYYVKENAVMTNMVIGVILISTVK